MSALNASNRSKTDSFGGLFVKLWVTTPTFSEQAENLIDRDPPGFRSRSVCTDDTDIFQINAKQGAEFRPPLYLLFSVSGIFGAEGAFRGN